MKSIGKKIQTLLERLQKLKALRQDISSFSEYQSRPFARDIAERNLHVAVEACLDIGKMIVSNKKLNEPKDNKGVFIALAEAGFIKNKTLEFMIPMIGTRNILVHGYDKIDDEIIYGVLKRHLSDFDEFLREIRKIN